MADCKGPRLFSVLGDSISTYEGCNPTGYRVFYTPDRSGQAGLRGPEDTWWSQVISHFGGRLLRNASYSGSLVEGAGFPAGESPERAAALGTDWAAPDDVLVFIGINDYGWGGAHLQAAGRGATTPVATDLSGIPEAAPGEAPEDALDRFGLAYRRMLAHIRKAWPRARIWCLSLVPGRTQGKAKPDFCWNLRARPFAAYNEAIRSACAGEGAGFLNLCAYGYDYDSLEGTHPTRLGMRQLADLTIAAMEGAPAPDHTAFANPNTGFWRSQEWRCGCSAVRCPWARGTSQTWYCTCVKPR